MNNNVWACMIIAAIHTTAEGTHHRVMFVVFTLAAMAFAWLQHKK